MEQKLDIKLSAGSIFLFTLPTIITILFTTIYAMVGSIFTAQLVNTNALSAINICAPIVNVTFGIGMMTASGGNAIISKTIGEGDEVRARRIFSFLFYVTTLVGLVMCLLGLAFIKPIITFLGGSDPAVYEYCEKYLKTTLIFVPFDIAAVMLLFFSVTAGKAAMGTVIAILGGVITIILDYVCISVMNMGIVGAALATGLGYAIPAVIGTLYFVFFRNASLYFVSPLIEFKLLLKSCSNGISELVSYLSGAVILLLFNITVIKLRGSEGVAALTIILYGQQIVSSVFMGFSSGVSPLISYNYGKKDTDNLKKVFKNAIKIVAVTALFLFTLAMVFGNSFALIFSEKDSEVYNMAIYGFKIFSFAFLFMGFSVFSSAMFTALSNGKISAVISVMRTLLINAGCIIILSKIFGMNGIWISVPISELLSLILSFFLIMKYKRTYNY